MASKRPVERDFFRRLSGVILEYQLGNTSRRLDAMLTGRSSSSAENAVVVELKQSSDGLARRSSGRKR